jgi:hypothetical protein
MIYKDAVLFKLAKTGSAYEALWKVVKKNQRFLKT